MRLFLSMALILIGFLTNAQTPGWTPLSPSVGQPNLEFNPLKGIASNFGETNDFHSNLRGKVYQLGEIYNGNEIDFATIDALLDNNAVDGRYTILQINVDDARFINPLDVTTLPDGTVTYPGIEADLPDFLDAVDRLYYLGGKPENQIPENDLVNRVFNKLPDDGAGNPSLVVNYNDPLLINTVLSLIEQLGNRYDNDPRIFSIGWGIYGIFGELQLGAGKAYIDDLVDANGNNLGLTPSDWEMTKENQLLISNAYIQHFPNTNLIARDGSIPLAQNFGFSDGLAFGASISNTNSSFFIPGLKINNVDNNWKNRIIGGEMDPFLQPQVWGDVAIDPTDERPLAILTNTGDPFITSQEPQNVQDVIEQTHMTFVYQNYMFQSGEVGGFRGDNHRASPDQGAFNLLKYKFQNTDNTAFWDNAIAATKAMGYNFHVNEVNLSAQAGQPAVEVNIMNTGVAPIYADWDVEFAVLDSANQLISIGASGLWNLDKILPGNSDNKRKFIPATNPGLNPGTYTFLMRVINPLNTDLTVFNNGATTPETKNYDSGTPLRFDNATQDANLPGWLTLGTAILDGNSDSGVFPEIVTSFTPNGPTTGLSMNLLSELQLSVSIVPSNAPYQWKSSAPGIATVDQNGLVSSSGGIPGNVTITAFTPDGQEINFEIEVSRYWEIVQEIGEVTRIEAELYSAIFEGGENGAPKGSLISGTEDLGEVAVTNISSLKDENGDVIEEFWIEFDVDVKAAKDYKIDLRAAHPFSADLNILVKLENSTTYDSLSDVSLPFLPECEFVFSRDENGEILQDQNGNDSTDFVAIFNIFKTTTSPSFSLPVGRHTIRIESDGYNLNWIEFKVDPCFEFTGTVGDVCVDNDPNTFFDRTNNDCTCEGIPLAEFVPVADGTVIEAEDFSNVIGDVSLGTDPVIGCDGKVVEFFDGTDVLEYAIDVQGTETKLFQIDLSAANPFGANVEIEVINTNGVSTLSSALLAVVPVEERICAEPIVLDDSGNCAIDFGANFAVYRTATSNPIELEPGKQLLRIKGGYNLNWIEFREIGLEYVPIPSLIEAESYTSVTGGSSTVTISGGPDDGQTAIGFIGNGDRFEYAVSVAAGGADFELDFRAVYNSVPFDARVNILDANGNALTATPVILGEGLPGGVYGTTTSEVFSLPGGDQIITIEVVASNFDLNWIEFRDNTADTELPVAVCNNLTISLEPSEVVTITAAQLDGGSTDNEGIASISIDQNTFDINDLGANNVTLTVTDNSGNVATCIATVTVEETVLSVTKFFLVDAESNLDIQEIVDGEVIDLATVPSVSFNIRAETTDDVESVRLELNGPVSNTRTENVAPYAAFGDSNSNYNGEAYETGVYDISADPYSANNLQGDLGTALSISFEFVGTPNILSVQRFFLVDADSDLDIQEIVEGDVINLTSLPSTNLDIRAETTNDVESVRLELNGPVSNTRTENFAPYALFGDSNGDYNGNTLTAGTYSIEATPFSQNSLGGAEGFSLDLNFTLTVPSAGHIVDHEILMEDAEVVSSNPSSDQDTALEKQDLGMDKLVVNEKLSVWPNPFQDKITLKLEHGRTYKRVFIQDLKGVVLTNVELDGRVGGEQVNMQVNGPAGMYLMYVETNDGIEVEKIIKF